MSNALAPLRHANFRRLALGRATNMLGNGVAPIALAFAVLRITGSVTELGLVVAARSLFNVVFLLFGGVVADRMPRRLVLVGSSALSAASQGSLAALVLTHHATIPLMLVLSACNGTFAAFALPASSALLPQTVPTEERRQANAINRMGANSAMIGGAALGGAVVAAAGPGWGLAIDAASFALSGLCFFRVRVRVAPLPDAADAAPPARRGMFRELHDGWREFVARRWVWVIVAAFGFLNAAFSGTVQVLGPTIADRSFGSGGWGLVLSTQTLGMLVGGVIGLRIRPQRLLLVGVSCMAAEALLPSGLALGMPVASLAVMNFLAGMAVEQFGIAWETSLQQEIPEERLARVYSYDALGSFLAIPLAQATIGPLSTAIGVHATLLGAAAVILACTVAMLAVHDVRALKVRAA
ncbi:MFS transporter [Streptacidiphilus fuscans]|uniref:MFS transporter n=1 Tax=Streptacidiphilus fuscans TaxID=2789292 RepID=A0A931BCF7_9ACTN|nr:MFS transporter [Streptacidiphilus fuscans]MBF9073657.1 MFS transporter [Streptacidiphilus fuscans]